MRPRRALKTPGVLVAALAMVIAAAAPASAAGYQRPGTTTRVSVTTAGAQVVGHNIDPTISADGRYVVFASSASTLVPGDTNGAFDIFVRDLQTGVTERVSVASDGTQANGPSANGLTTYRAAITPGGRYVAFVSDATNLVPGDTNKSPDIFVHDRVTRRTELISVSSSGEQGNNASVAPAISADGRYVAFASAATNLVPGDANGKTDIFVRDRVLNVTELVAVSTAGEQSNGHSIPPAINANGRYVIFGSAGSNLVPGDANGADDVFLRDRVAGTTERISVAVGGGSPNGHSNVGSISADGRFVAFDSSASNLVPEDTNTSPPDTGLDVFVFDRQTQRTERVSVASDGREGSGGVAYYPGISADGRYVSFQSDMPNLVPDDTNNRADVFVHDRLSGTTERVTISSSGAQGNGTSLDATVSTDGRYVGFSSTSSNLVPGDTNGYRDVFVRDRGSAAGIGSMSASQFLGFGGMKVRATGWATFSGAEVASAEDPPDDGGNQAAEVGAELTGASVIHRPELGDLLIRIQLARLPGLGSEACDRGIECSLDRVARPGVMYGLEFELDGVRYEVRGMRLTGTSIPPSTPYFGLFRCLNACAEISRLGGAIGTTGSEVRVALPTTALNVEEAALRDLRAFAGFGEVATGMARELDEVLLPDADIEPPKIRLGVAGPGVPYPQVPFTATAPFINGVFEGTLDAPPGSYRLWADACFAGACAPVSVLKEA